MKKKFAFALAVILLATAACQKIPVEEEENIPQPQTEFKGKVIAGTATPYLAYSREDYELALTTRPYVVLYFYANWCPICAAEQPKTKEAFNELSRADMVGFRVNFRDSDTDENEAELARQFGVAYQHTKVVLKNGERILKSPESWSKEDYLTNLEKI
ncbi:MAG TPA: thioredoxin family protein [Candidatus Nanoarchaeia archaeon]|nr:thioredoxin family protein [Candidatus Nanoarchaeia archaeon]